MSHMTTTDRWKLHHAISLLNSICSLLSDSLTLLMGRGQCQISRSSLSECITYGTLSLAVKLKSEHFTFVCPVGSKQMNVFHDVSEILTPTYNSVQSKLLDRFECNLCSFYWGYIRYDPSFDWRRTVRTRSEELQRIEAGRARSAS